MESLKATEVKPNLTPNEASSVSTTKEKSPEEINAAEIAELREKVADARREFREAVRALDGLSSARPLKAYAESKRIRSKSAELDRAYTEALNALVKIGDLTTIGPNIISMSFLGPTIVSNTVAHVTVVTSEWRAVHEAISRTESTAIAIVALYISIASLVLTVLSPFLIA